MNSLSGQQMAAAQDLSQENCRKCIHVSGLLRCSLDAKSTTKKHVHYSMRMCMSSFIDVQLSAAL